MNCNLLSGFVPLISRRFFCLTGRLRTEKILFHTFFCVARIYFIPKTFCMRYAKDKQ